MFGAPVSQGLTLSKVISGISKTLGIANQVIPLYREAKPMIQNARTILGVLKDLNKPSQNNSNNGKNKEITKKSTIPKESTYIKANNPVFFL